MSQDNTQIFSVSLLLDEGEVILSGDEIKQFYFVEDIFSLCMTGKLLMVDTRGIFEFGPITGNEIIRVFYSSGENPEEEESFELEFKVYKISRVDQLNVSHPHSEESIEIFFADYMFFNMNNYVYSYSWKDKKIHEIIKDIGNNMLLINEHPKGWHHFENTNETLDLFYMPYWTPNTAINWLIKRATGRDSEESGYCFYNSPHGVNFVTMAKLMQQSLMAIGTNEETYMFESSNPNYFNKILNWSISGLDMTSLKHLSGGIKVGIDSHNKKFIKKEYEYKKSIRNHTILGNKTLFPDISNTSISFDNMGESDETLIDNRYYNMWAKRYSLQHCTSFIVKGHQERYAGGTIYVNWPSVDEEEQQYNKHLDGGYLIKSITHIFSGYKNPPYKQKLVCIKNGYEESDVDVLENSVKREMK